MRETVQDSSAEKLKTAELPVRSCPADVDVIIAVWNGENTIARAVRSALAEPEVNRVIVIDDQSTDRTCSVVASLIDDLGDRIFLHRLEQNAGPAAARNCGLGFSEALWITILDSDDYFMPGRMRALVEASDGADFIADDLLQVDEGDGNNLSGRCLIGLKTPLQLDFMTFLSENISRAGRPRKEFGFLKPMIRRTFLQRNCLKYDDKLRLGEDFALYARALAVGAVFKVIPGRAYVSVVRSGSISGNHSKKDLELLRDSDKILQQLPTLTSQEQDLVKKHYESIDARVQWLNVIEAVKARNVTAFLSAFLIRRTTSLYLINRLLEQIIVRGRKVLRIS